jgi:hypothetical protein
VSLAASMRSGGQVTLCTVGSFRTLKRFRLFGILLGYEEGLRSLLCGA